MVLFVAGILGGAVNAVAGGGSFVAFPALLFVGVPPIPANATNCFSLWVGTSASGGAYRNRFSLSRRGMVPLGLTRRIGGPVGGIFFLKNPAHTIMRGAPWLVLGATLLLAFRPKPHPPRPS